VVAAVVESWLGIAGARVAAVVVVLIAEAV
jgi:hypothetical protein